MNEITFAALCGVGAMIVITFMIWVIRKNWFKGIKR